MEQGSLSSLHNTYTISFKQSSMQVTAANASIGNIVDIEGRKKKTEHEGFGKLVRYLDSRPKHPAPLNERNTIDAQLSITNTHTSQRSAIAIQRDKRRKGGEQKKKAHSTLTWSRSRHNTHDTRRVHNQGSRPIPYRPGHRPPTQPHRDGSRRARHRHLLYRSVPFCA